MYICLCGSPKNVYQAQHLKNLYPQLRFEHLRNRACLALRLLAFHMGCPWRFLCHFTYLRWGNLRKLIFTVHMKWGLCDCDYVEYVCKGVWGQDMKHYINASVVTTIRSNMNYFCPAWSHEMTSFDSWCCYPSNPTVIIRIFGGGGPSSHQEKESHRFQCQRLNLEGNFPKLYFEGSWGSRVLDHRFTVNFQGVWNRYWHLLWFVWGQWMNMNEHHVLFLVEPVYFLFVSFCFLGVSRNGKNLSQKMTEVQLCREVWKRVWRRFGAPIFCPWKLARFPPHHFKPNILPQLIFWRKPLSGSLSKNICWSLQPLLNI